MAVSKKVKTSSLKTTNPTPLAVQTLRVLASAMVAKAQSGHTGMALSAAPIVYSLFANHITVDPKNPHFANRDRFVLSAGHGSALLYALLHLSGFALTMKDLQNFRQLNAKTAGHPENFLCPGVDATTGPLGQGVGIALGFALAASKLKAYFAESQLFDYYTYCLLGDGCIQEGVSHEAFSLAGRLQMDKLIYLYDSNEFQLEGKSSDSTKINWKKYFESLGFYYLEVSKGNDVSAIDAAITAAKTNNNGKPSMIVCKTTIGYGGAYAHSAKAHGGIFNPEQLLALKQNLQYPYPEWQVPQAAYDAFVQLQNRGTQAREFFTKKLQGLKSQNPKSYQMAQKVLENDWTVSEKWFNTNKVPNQAATRDLSFAALQTILNKTPLATVLSADLSSSTKIGAPNSTYDVTNRLGIQINLGVREFLMSTVALGISLSHLPVFSSTFLSFADYCKPALRLAAISQANPVFVFSHDSIALGEDGPTHQPIEQLWSLRLMPNHLVFRPSNWQEMVQAFCLAFANQKGPSTIITCRQTLPNPQFKEVAVSRGAYVAVKKKNNALNLLATGSELHLATAVAMQLAADYAIECNVISMVCVELFHKQMKSYKHRVFNDKPTVAIEFGSTLPWSAFAGLTIGLDQFGASAPYEKLLQAFKLTVPDVCKKIHQWYLANHFKT